MATAKIYTSHVLRFTATTNGLGIDGSTTLDSNGDAMTLPRGFVIDDGYLFVTDGVALGSVDLGISGGDVDGLVDGLDNASGAAAARFAVTVASEALTGVGIANQGDVGNTLILTQRTAAEVSATVVEIMIMGHYEFDA